MQFQAFSPRQQEALTWWCPGSPHRERDAVICDGAVRSGKTLCLSLAFVAWSMAGFDATAFALCGKTVKAVRRNVVIPLLPLLEELGFSCRENLSQGVVEIACGGRKNRYYLFGGKDEGAAAHIQGVTLGGILFDEVALMPRSFVEQGLARCSVEGSRFWFNCNPEHPGHWFYTDWICRTEEKNALYLHFTMADNPALSREMRGRYERLYTGRFYQRYVLGRWVAGEGLVYPMFSPRKHITEEIPACGRYVISCDYGTVNPASFGLWGQGPEGLWYRLREYYHDSRRTGVLRTDEEYADALEALAGELPVELVLADPSAASFIQCIRRRGRLPVRPAQNRVADGVRLVSGALKAGRLRFHSSCRDTIREFARYRWEPDGERPRKEDDHAMDDIRYFAAHVFGDEGGAGGFAAAAVRRGPAP